MATRLQRLLTTLGRAHRGAAEPLRDPWHAILYENVAYLCTDDARDRAFAALERATGLDPAGIVEAPDDVLLEVCGAGKVGARCVDKLRECAQFAVTVGDPRALVKLPPAQARAALKRFPGIGDPGADRLLLFAGAAAPVALESNGLRALLRLGYGTEAANYATSYRSARVAAEAELPRTAVARQRLFTSMRQHGRAICRATPNCAACAVADDCPSRRGSGRR